MNSSIRYDHYKETYAKNVGAQTDRNKFFLLSLVCIAGLTGFIILPDLLVRAVLSWLEVDVSANISTLVGVTQSSIWALLLFVLIRYVQASIQVERTYPYIHVLEQKLGFQREGDDYLNDYPAALGFIDFFYKTLYPLAIIALVFAKSIVEWTNKNADLAGCIIDSIFALLIVVLMTLYMAFLYSISQHYDGKNGEK